MASVQDKAASEEMALEEALHKNNLLERKRQQDEY